MAVGVLAAARAGVVVRLVIVVASERAKRQLGGQVGVVVSLGIVSLRHDVALFALECRVRVGGLQVNGVRADARIANVRVAFDVAGRGGLQQIVRLANGVAVTARTLVDGGGRIVLVAQLEAARRECAAGSRNRSQPQPN